MTPKQFISLYVTGLAVQRLLFGHLKVLPLQHLYICKVLKLIYLRSGFFLRTALKLKRQRYILHT